MLTLRLGSAGADGRFDTPPCRPCECLINDRQYGCRLLRPRTIISNVVLVGIGGHVQITLAFRLRYANEQHAGMGFIVQYTGAVWTQDEQHARLGRIGLLDKSGLAFVPMKSIGARQSKVAHTLVAAADRFPHADIEFRSAGLITGICPSVR
ncbi:hypothetical protein DDE05_08995 [Streptomyces cavourensis]|nr:hypothetical protein DDE05_08995 [Streptomyces cavourensis]